MHLLHGGAAACGLLLAFAPSASSQPTSFRLEVAPILSKAGCNQGACHGALSGKGGFRLSLRGDDPQFDWIQISRDALSRRIDRNNPSASLLLMKPAGVVPHEGGKRFDADSDEHRILARWIGEGAADDSVTAPTVVRLEVDPPSRILRLDAGPLALKATASLSDGRTLNVTKRAAYDLSDPTRAKISAAGVVEAFEPAELAVSVRYAGARAVSRLTFSRAGKTPSVASAPAANSIDRSIQSKLLAIRTVPAPSADDSAFLRRAYLRTIGVLPKPAEVRAFLADRSPAKRETLAHELVKRPEFADFWALKWADVLRNETKSMGTKGAWSFQRWLVSEVSRDAPVSETARSLLTGVGSTWANPPASFHRTSADPTAAAETAGQVFLGYRIQCAKCHNHPFDVWRQDDYYGFAAYFANVGRKERDVFRKDGLDRHDLNGDVVVFTSGSALMENPTSHRMLPPKSLGAAKGAAVNDNLKAAADWITCDPQFSRNFANRTWYHLMGRGVVDPPDDFRDSNPPSNPGLLDALQSEFVRDGLRLKPLIARILASSAFQRSSDAAKVDSLGEANFAAYPMQTMSAEVLLDSVSQVLEQPELFRGAPLGLRATQLPGAGGEVPFLKSFGKPQRLLTCECERTSSSTLSQAFQMINGESFRNKLAASDNRIGRLLEAKKSDAEMLEEFTLAAFCRFPTAEEKGATVQYVSSSKDRRKAWEDVVWAILNSKEFLLIR